MRATRPSSLAVLPLVVAVACPPSGEGSATTATTDTSTSSTASGAEATSSTSSTTSTTDAPTTTSTTAETSAATTMAPEPESICDPQPALVLGDFSVDGDDSPGFEDIEFDHLCTVMSVTQGTFLTVALGGCKADPNDPNEEPVTHTVDAEVSPGGPIDPVPVNDFETRARRI